MWDSLILTKNHMDHTVTFKRWEWDYEPWLQDQVTFEFCVSRRCTKSLLPFNYFKTCPFRLQVYFLLLYVFFFRGHTVSCFRPYLKGGPGIFVLFSLSLPHILHSLCDRVLFLNKREQIIFKTNNIILYTNKIMPLRNKQFSYCCFCANK